MISLHYFHDGCDASGFCNSDVGDGLVERHCEDRVMQQCWGDEY